MVLYTLVIDLIGQIHVLILTNQINKQSIIPSTDVIQLTLTLKMTTAKVVETLVTVNNNSPIQDYVHPDDQTQPTFGSLLTNYARGKLPWLWCVCPFLQIEHHQNK